MTSFRPGIRRSLIAILLLQSAVSVAADALVRQLPDLPATNAGPGRVHLDGNFAAIGYRDRVEKWDAKFDQYQRLDPALSVDYGTLLTERLGAGMTLTHRGTNTEVLVNGVYALKHNVRLQLSGGQLRASPADAGSVSQQSVLVGARKVWGADRLLSDMGVAAYSVDADSRTAATGGAPETADDGGHGIGKLDGYMLQVGLQPTASSRIELQHNAGQINYAYSGQLHQGESTNSNRLRYSTYLGSCTQLQSGYQGSADSDRVDIGIAMRNWRFTLSHAHDAVNADTALRVGYAIPLGGSGHAAQRCMARPDKPRALEPMVDATTKRPVQFPAEPLIKPIEPVNVP